VHPCIQIFFDRLIKIIALEKLQVQYSENTPAAFVSYACKFTHAPLSLTQMPDSHVFPGDRQQLLVSTTMAATRG
jgi:hypothetical protein